MRVTASSEAELRAFLDSGVMAEGHHLDAKRMISPGRGANLELARDLASFAIDGGVLLLGVDEDKKTGTFSLAPQPLKDLAERVEQVSQTRVAPRLTVRFREIRSTADEEVGYLIVDVPPSPEAPHMVGGRYYGRGDKTKHVLTDHDVRRLLGLRHDRRVRFRDRLAAEVERGPAPPDEPEAHMFMVAAPCTGRPEQLYDALVRSGSSLRHWAENVLLGDAPRPPLDRSRQGYYLPEIYVPLELATSANGIGLYRDEGGAPPITTSREEEEKWKSERRRLTRLPPWRPFQLEIDDDGTIHLFCGVVTKEVAERRLMHTPLVAGLTARVIRTAVHVSDAVPYSGSWDIGLQLTNLRGVLRSSNGWQVSERAVAYSEDGYTAAEQFLVEDLSRDERSVVNRLCGRLYRGLGEDLTTWVGWGDSTSIA